MSRAYGQYTIMQGHIEKWAAPCSMAAAQLRAVGGDVISQLAERTAADAPEFCEALKSAALTVLEEADSSVRADLEALIEGERDPFSANDFFQAHVNKVRYDRFERAVTESVAGARTDDWASGAGDIATQMKGWYRETHGLTARANAEEVLGLLEAYWHLAARRVIDTGVEGMTRARRLGLLSIAKLRGRSCQ